MERKMAGSLENIYDAMETLRQSACPLQEAEIMVLTEFTLVQSFGSALQEWDINYWAGKHRSTVLNVKDEFVRNLFPLPYVLNALRTGGITVSNSHCREPKNRRSLLQYGRFKGCRRGVDRELLSRSLREKRQWPRNAKGRWLDGGNEEKKTFSYPPNQLLP